MRDSASHVQSFECQVGACSSELALTRGEMTRVEGSITAAQLDVTDAKYALFAVGEEHAENRSAFALKSRCTGVWMLCFAVLVAAWSVIRL